MMTRPFRLSAVCLLALAASSYGTPAPARAEALPAPATAFVHVNVVPLDTERVLWDQTVLVADGRIAAVGRRLAIPTNARVEDGKGAFLSPGLADMHVHSDTREDLEVYLANGVTSVLNMGGASAGFMDQLRTEVNAGRRPGPHIYAAFRVDGSPRYNNFVIDTPEQARAIVGIAKTNGYQFIKVYNDLSPACFEALIDEGGRQHLPVVGHGVTAIGLRHQLAAGQVMVAHTEEFLYTVFYGPDHLPDTEAPDAAQIPGVVDFVLREKAFVTADLNTYAVIARQWGKPGVAAALLRIPETRYLSPRDRILWGREDYKTRKGSLAARLAFLQRFTKAMSDGGVPLVAGTDAPSLPGLVPGFSLHDDLDALESAGLSRFQALATATRNPGQFIRRTLPAEEPFGTVAAGGRADLILTRGNPLRDLSVLRRPLGVMAGGKWYPASELRALLRNVAAQYAAATIARRH